MPRRVPSGSLVEANSCAIEARSTPTTMTPCAWPSGSQYRLIEGEGDSARRRVERKRHQQPVRTSTGAPEGWPVANIRSCARGEGATDYATARKRNLDGSELRRFKLRALQFPHAHRRRNERGDFVRPQKPEHDGRGMVQETTLRRGEQFGMPLHTHASRVQPIVKFRVGPPTKSASTVHETTATPTRTRTRRLDRLTCIRVFRRRRPDIVSGLEL